MRIRDPWAPHTSSGYSTLHEDLTAGFAELKDEMQSGFTDLRSGVADLKMTLITGFRSLPSRESSEEMVRCSERATDSTGAVSQPGVAMRSRRSR